MSARTRSDLFQIVSRLTIKDNQTDPKDAQTLKAEYFQQKRAVRLFGSTSPSMHRPWLSERSGHAPAGEYSPPAGALVRRVGLSFCLPQGGDYGSGHG